MKSMLRVVGAFVAAGAATFGAVQVASGGANPPPLPFGAAPALYTEPDGTINVRMAPERAPVLALDGTPLRSATGAPLTAPFGDVLRGELTQREADLQVQTLVRLARGDACRRGVEVGLFGESTNARTLEESIAQAKRDLAAKIKANGGKETASTC